MVVRKKRDGLTRNKERASISFFIVIIFFALCGIIILTELLLMDERNYDGSVINRRGTFYDFKKNRLEYDDNIQAEDFLKYSNGIRNDFSQEVINKLFNDNNLFKSEITKSTTNKKKSIEKIISENGIPLFSDVELSLGIGLKILPMNIETHLPSYDSNLLPKDGVWQNVNGTRNKFFVFSAYYDQRKYQRILRIIGATKTRSTEKVWCRLWYNTEYQIQSSPSNNSTQQNKTSSTGPSSLTVLAKIKVIRENWNLKYSACFVLCPLANTPDEIPSSVSIVYDVKKPPTNRLLVNLQPTEIDKNNENKIAICVKPLHFQYNQVIKMLEFLELNALLGVNHFTFYNHTVGDQVNCVLNEYKRKQFQPNPISLAILPWNLDMISQKEIRTEGLFAALNDCLYRNMFKYPFVAMVDLDEYIIPKYNYTLIDLIQWIRTRMSIQHTGSYSFQNGFFYLQWNDDPQVYETKDKIEASLITVKKTRRKLKLHPHKQRSKFICKPEKVVEVGNHFVWEFLPGYGTLNIPSDAAILHHYRICEFGGDDCIKTSSVIDKSAYKYKNELTTKINQIYEELSEQCQLDPLPDLPTKKSTKINKRKARILNKDLLTKNKPIFEKYIEYFLKS